MMTVSAVTSLIIILISLKTLNPMKMIFTMLALSGVIFLMISARTGSVWVSVILFMMFMGGVLISFMLIASLMPNEKSMNLETTHLGLFFSLIALTPLLNMNSEWTMVNKVKETLMESLNLHSMTLVMLLYFLGFISILNQTKTPLRTTFCH